MNMSTPHTTGAFLLEPAGLSPICPQEQQLEVSPGGVAGTGDSGHGSPRTCWLGGSTVGGRHPGVLCWPPASSKTACRRAGPLVAGGDQVLGKGRVLMPAAGSLPVAVSLAVAGGKEQHRGCSPSVLVAGAPAGRGGVGAHLPGGCW